jgi:LysR family transcriptional regulator, benzoate and cis,cis-muconate-responsive activator of ben and cat genes
MDNPRMLHDLSHLRAFIAVAEELSFTHAAERLHVTQPPLSRSIRRLERDVGVPLFDRTSRSVTLTPAGRALLEHARSAVFHADRGFSAARRAAREANRTLRVGFSGSLAGGFIPRAARRFAEAQPGVTLDLSEAVPVELREELDHGRLDVAVLYSFDRRWYEHDGLAVETLGTDPAYAALPAAHPLAGSASVALSALAREPWIVMSGANGVDVQEAYAELARLAGAELQVTQEATSVHVILGLVAAGVGVSVLPPSMIDDHPAGVAFVPVADALAFDLLGIVAAGETSELAHAFLDVAGTSGAATEEDPTRARAAGTVGR